MTKVFWKIVLWIVLMIGAIALGTLFWIKGWETYALLMLVALGCIAYRLYTFQVKTHTEVTHFLESVKYRDFSRYFDTKNGSIETRLLRKGFNDINNTFKSITREKEMQYQYLQKMLELVDTGILSYKEPDGSIVWVNETLKKMIDIPYLRTIHSLEKRNPSFYEEVLSLKPGKNKVVSLNDTNRVLISCTSFQTDGTVFRVLALQNVNEALDANEVESWEKLLRVLTHEIMNSVAPISSLADTLKKRIEKRDETDLIADLEQGIDTIKRRSEGLIRFAETYRNLNRIHSIHKKQVLVRDLFENISVLMQPTLDQKNIELDIILKNANLVIDADINLLEQVLINLVINAVDAVKAVDSPVITLTGTVHDNNAAIKVSDNGKGIPEDLLDQIFVPFFSTRKNGSGIGLSVCKQIVLLHGGSIKVMSKENEGTIFTVEV